MRMNNKVKDMSAIFIFIPVKSIPNPKSRNIAVRSRIAILRTEPNAILSTTFNLICVGKRINVNANPGMNNVSAMPKIIFMSEEIILRI